MELHDNSSQRSEIGDPTHARCSINDRLTLSTAADAASTPELYDEHCQFSDLLQLSSEFPSIEQTVILDMLDDFKGQYLEVFHKLKVGDG